MRPHELIKCGHGHVLGRRLCGVASRGHLEILAAHTEALFWFYGLAGIEMARGVVDDLVDEGPAQVLAPGAKQPLMVEQQAATIMKLLCKWWTCAVPHCCVPRQCSCQNELRQSSSSRKAVNCESPWTGYVWPIRIINLQPREPQAEALMFYTDCREGGLHDRDVLIFTYCRSLQTCVARENLCCSRR